MRLASLAATGVVALLSVTSSGASAQGIGLGLHPAFAPVIAEAARSAPNATASAETTHAGEFTTLTYNVAGIPQFFSDEQPSRNNPLIGPLLDPYDLVLIQEDFIYHDELAAGVRHPHHAPAYPLPASFVTLGDGLSQFSRYPIEGFEREGWTTCSGLVSRMSDCTARKGFSYSRVALAAGVSVDVYNLHLDAGGSEGDFEARDVQVAQFLEAVRLRSEGRPIIVAGDTNMRRRGTDPANLERLREDLGLTDACDTLRCGGQRVDRVFFRSGGGLTLYAADYWIPSEFVDDVGLPLSDHLPVAVRFDWEYAPDAVALAR